MELIGVFKNSFIITRSGFHIFAVDQHAAHERINLEKLLNGMAKENIKLETPTILKNSISKFPKMKLQKCKWKFSEEMDELVMTYVLRINGIVIENVNGMFDFTKDTLSDSIYIMPDCILHALRNKVCRTAIKIGDSISDDGARYLLNELAKCHRRNHCAHGRPVIIPIYDLENINSKFRPL